MNIEGKHYWHETGVNMIKTVRILAAAGVALHFVVFAIELFVIRETVVEGVLFRTIALIYLGTGFALTYYAKPFVIRRFQGIVIIFALMQTAMISFNQNWFEEFASLYYIGAILLQFVLIIIIPMTKLRAILTLVALNAIYIFMYLSNAARPIEASSINLIIASLMLTVAAIAAQWLLQNHRMRDFRRRRQLASQATEINLQKEELKDLNATKDKFFSIIAHDLRSPFNSLIHLSERLLLDSAKYNGDFPRESVESINRLSRDAYRLLENILDWSRAQDGRLNPNIETVNLRALSDECVQICGDIAKAKNVKIKNEISAKSIALSDVNMTLTIIRNLLTNSIKFTRDGGVITIRAERKGERVFVSVKDDGVGMSGSTLENLFSNETNSSRGTNNEKGAGIGLLLVKDFVEALGGEIRAESEVGSGSKFTFSLQAAIEPQIAVEDDLENETAAAAKFERKTDAIYDKETIELMKNEFIPESRRLGKEPFIDEIEALAEKIRVQGEKSGIKRLETLGERLAFSARRIDVPAIRESFAALEELLPAERFEHAGK